LTAETDRTASLSDYVRMMRAQRWIVLLAVVLCAGAAVALSLRQDEQYAATAQLDYQGDNQALSLVGAPAYPERTNKEQADLGAQTALQDDPLRRVRQALHTRRSVDELRGMLAAAVDPQSNLVSITATAPGARFAARLATTLARQSAADAAREQRTRYRDTVQRLRAKQRRLGGGPRAAQQSRIYGEQITRLETLASLARPVRVAQAASVPETPVSPKPVRDGVLGALAGLLLGLALAFGRDALDRRLRNLDDIQTAVELPVLGHVRRRAMRGGVALEPADQESFTLLRTMVGFLDVDDPLRTLAVTSAATGEGKSTVAAALALSYAESGHRTLLVECDLRRPVLGERLDVDTITLGLTDLLARKAELADVVHTLDGSGLNVVLAGSRTPRPAELLGSERFQAFVAEVRETYDMVIFDTSPLLALADTLQLLPRMDGALVCVRSGQTTREEVEALNRSLHAVPHGPVGLVITGITPATEGVYGYGNYAYAS
jgi:receptor protein-tyrosine kinase